MNRISRWWLDLRIARAEARLSAIRMRPHYTAELNEAFDQALALKLRLPTLDPVVRNLLEGKRG